MKLPDEFLMRMKEQLKEDYQLFLASYNNSKFSGLRANSIKISSEELAQRLTYLTVKIPWCADGFYYNEEVVRPAKHPYYYAGLYYIQEPSAMLPAEMLQVQKNEKVLDLCAAPGGKSLQLAAALKGSGLLVVNDIQPRRAKVLLKNIERYGVINAVVLNEKPENLIKIFKGFFDKILVDAPCSGEGMFRKEPLMIKDWSVAAVKTYAAWQKQILAEAAEMLAPGGRMVYSTCTFSIEENEQQIEQFLQQHSDFRLVNMKRLWPHEVKGEGHFAALLEKRDSATAKYSNVNNTNGNTTSTVNEFIHEVWKGNLDVADIMPGAGRLLKRSGHVLYENNLLLELKGLNVLRSGWLIGTFEKGRFKPSQAFAMGLNNGVVGQAVKKIKLSLTNEVELRTIDKYLRGETIQIADDDYENGYYLICADEYPIGWVKYSGGIFKNELPPGWRITDGGAFNAGTF